MNTPQLLKLLDTNRELIIRSNAHAEEHFQMLRSDYSHINDEEVLLSMELSASLAEKHIHSNHSKAIENSLRVVNSYTDSPHTYYLARHYWVIGHSCVQQARHDDAEKYLLCALQYEVNAVDLKSDVLIALAMNEEFRCGGQGSIKAAGYLKQALGLLHEEEHVIRRAACMMGLGNVLINGGELDESLQMYQQAVAIYEQFFDLANMAAGYCNIGTNYYQRKDYDNAEKFINKSLELRLKTGSPDDLGISYYNLAILHKETGRLQSAYDLLVKTRDIERQTGHVHNLEKTEQQLQDLESLIATNTAAA